MNYAKLSFVLKLSSFIFVVIISKLNPMLGAIIGDVVGSIYEWKNHKSKEFPLLKEKSRFTDDTVMTVAVADCLLHEKSYETTFQTWGNKYPQAGYGGTFRKWLKGSVKGSYNSWGNGSGMRVSPVGYAFGTLEETLLEAERSAAVTHSHPEGIKGAQVIASAVFMARNDASKEDIRRYISENFNYKLDRSIDEIRPTYTFDVSCQGSVPEAVISFLESENYEDAIRNAISLGGDSDTIACMAGAIAEAYYQEIPATLIQGVRQRLPEEMMVILDKFKERFN